MDSVEKARRAALNTLVAKLREGDGNIPEADATMNGASRRVVQAYIAEYGKAWLGKSNADKDGPLLWEVNEDSTWPIVYNFGADFVVPEYDADLESRIQKYLSDGLTHAFANIDAIHDRVKELGGALLIWS